MVRTLIYFHELHITQDRYKSDGQGRIAVIEIMGLIRFSEISKTPLVRLLMF